MVSGEECKEGDVATGIMRTSKKTPTNTRNISPLDSSFPDFCAPRSLGDICFVVTGGTAILLDSNAAFAQDAAYEAISEALSDLDYLKLFAPDIVRAKFLQNLRESLVIPSSGSSTSSETGTMTATVAIATASVTFVVASMFCYGIMRREFRNPSEPSHRHKQPRKPRRSKSRVVRNPIGIQRKSRDNFVLLDDSSLSETIFPEEESKNELNVYRPNPAFSWSVSDITSDSCSILSSVSRRLESIVEEEECDDCGSYGEDCLDDGGAVVTPDGCHLPSRQEKFDRRTVDGNGDDGRKMHSNTTPVMISEFQNDEINAIASSGSLDIDPPHYDNLSIDEVLGGGLPSITVSTIDDDMELNSHLFDTVDEKDLGTEMGHFDRLDVNYFDASFAHRTVMLDPSVSVKEETAQVSTSDTHDQSSASLSYVSTIVGRDDILCDDGQIDTCSLDANDGSVVSDRSTASDDDVSKPMEEVGSLGSTALPSLSGMLIETYSLSRASRGLGLSRGDSLEEARLHDSTCSNEGFASRDENKSYQGNFTADDSMTARENEILFDTFYCSQRLDSSVSTKQNSSSSGSYDSFNSIDHIKGGDENGDDLGLPSSEADLQAKTSGLALSEKNSIRNAGNMEHDGDSVSENASQSESA
jgi:hypothetical protein